MARFVVDIDTSEFNPLADKTATLVEALEAYGYKVITVYGVLDDNRCQFDDPNHNVERMINSFRIVHDCVLSPPESAVRTKELKKKTNKELAAPGIKKKPAYKVKKKRGRPGFRTMEKAEVVEGEVIID